MSFSSSLHTDSDFSESVARKSIKNIDSFSQMSLSSVSSEKIIERDSFTDPEQISKINWKLRHQISDTLMSYKAICREFTSVKPENSKDHEILKKSQRKVSLDIRLNTTIAEPEPTDKLISIKQSLGILKTARRSYSDTKCLLGLKLKELEAVEAERKLLKSQLDDIVSTLREQTESTRIRSKSFCECLIQ